MPPARTRVCMGCWVERSIAEFRDEGDVTRGRPPKICRYCRAESEALQEHQRKNREIRPGAVAKQQAYADRSDTEIERDRRIAHPDGMKTCPPVAGCGETLMVGRFRLNRHQFDGLGPICYRCQNETFDARRAG